MAGIGVMSLYYEDDHVKLYHGDCLTEHREWLEADVLVTDPPYGMALRSGRGGAFGESVIANDETLEARDEAVALWGDRPAVIFGRWSEPKPTGTRMVLTWEKGEHVGMGDLMLPWKPNTEEIYILGSGFMGRRTGSVIKCHAIAGTVGQAAKGTRSHPTEKPLGLMQALAEKCPPGTIADPFAGSGSTLVAAKALGRKAIGVELEERYCEIAAKRLSQEAFDFGALA
jgi:site-specific DNA-methyltransferase (adenine-specific)